MPARNEHPPLSRPRGRMAAVAVLVICLVITLWAWADTRESVRQRAEAQFAFRVNDVVQSVDRRMRAYEQILRGGVALFHAEQVDRADWRRYVDHLDLEENFPGLQGMGYAVKLRASEVPALEARVQAEGFPAFEVWPAGDRETYSAILYLEPFDWRNQRAFGYDMYSEPVRRAAMQRARDTGRAALSGPVTLVQETEQDVQIGFLMYLPVYSGGEVPASVDLRRELLRGYVYSPFRMDDLMRGILPARLPELQLRVYDGLWPSANSLMYASNSGADQPPAFADIARIDVPGRTWTLRLTSEPGFEASVVERQRPILVLAGGGLISLLLFTVAWTLASLQRRASVLAATMADAFRRSEAKYSSLVQAATDAIIVVDADGNIASWNQGATELFGYDSEAVLGRPWTALLPEESRATCRRWLAELVQREGRLPRRVLELRAVNQSGDTFPIELSLARWGLDQEQYVSGIIRDTTARKRVETALRLAETRFRTALKSAPIAVFNQDRELRYTWVYNPQMGLTEGGLLGRTDAEVFGDPNLEAFKRQVLDSGEPLRREVAMSTGDRVFDLIVDPVIEDGRVTGLVGAAIDITALKRVERDLQASGARLRAIIENAAIGIAVSEFDGRLVEVNPAFAQMLGYSEAELLAMDTADLVHPDDRQASNRLFTELRRGERGYFKHDKRYLRRDGRVMWARVSASLLRDDAGRPLAVDEAGRPTLAIRIVEDITELREAEQALNAAYRELEVRVEARTAELRERTAELERSNQDLEQFAYIASHDLQEPLRSVSGFAQLLARRYREQLGPEGQEFIGFVVDGTTRMRQLIVDLLAFSRAGARQKPLVRVDGEEALQQALTNLHAAISERGAVVEHEPIPELWGDGADLVYLFQNLIGNGIKFNEAETPRVRVTVSDEGSRWRISVQDNGIGVEPRHFQRIFNIFQRVHRPEEYPGTGVGLAICKKIVDRLGGRIWLDSAPGQGATFHVELPKG